MNYFKKIKNIKDSQKRAKYLSLFLKKIIQIFKQPVKSTPVFIFGLQRSGTSMMMYSFHQHPETELFDESRDSVVFQNYRIKSYDAVRSVLEKSKFPFVIFKPLADTHLITDFIDKFPNCKSIYIYRNYYDVANSSLKKHPHATHAIKKVVERRSGGGWFQEGVSTKTQSILKQINCSTFSDYEWACLSWYVRNRIYFENDLFKNNNVILVNYEDLVSDPALTYSKIFKFLGMKQANLYKYIHKHNINKNQWPIINSTLKTYCDKLFARFNKFKI